MKKRFFFLMFSFVVSMIFLCAISTAEEKNILVDNITLSETNVVILKGESATVKAEVSPAEATNPKLDWQSSDTNVAVVSKGQIKGVNPGECDIICSAADDNGVKSLCHVEVRMPVKSIAVNEKQVILLVDASEELASSKLTYTVLPEDAYWQDVIWSSSDEEIVSVSADGAIKGLKAGKATVTAISTQPDSKAKAQVQIVVQQAVTGIELDAESTSVPIKRNITIKASVFPENASNKKLIWSSSDESIAKVTNKGQVQGVSAGEVTIKAISEDGGEVEASCNVKVYVPVQSLKMSITKEEVLYVGKEWNLGCTVLPENATDASVEWSSSDPAIAKVDEKGTVSALSAGKVVITATSKDGSNKVAQAKFYIPSLACNTKSVTLNSTNGKSIKFNYYGKNWRDDVTVTAQGTCFSYDTSKEGSEIELHLYPVSVGKGSITIRDKKDQKATFKVDIVVSSDAISLVQYVLFKKVSVNRGIVNITFFNNSGLDLAEIQFRIIPYNMFGEPLYLSNSIDEYDKELRWTNTQRTVKAGQQISDSLNWGYYYTGLAEVDITVDVIRLSNGERIELSENDLYWYSSKNNRYKSYSNKNVTNKYPSKSVIDKADSFKIGCSTSLIAKELVKRYGYHNVGYYISEVVPDSISDRAGLRVRDLIVSMDGVMVGDDPHIMEKTKAKIANGGSIEIVVERYAQDGTIEMIFTR